MKRNVYLILILLVFTTLIIEGCYYDKEDQLYPNSIACDVSHPTYNTTIKHIFITRCAVPGCHVPGSTVIDLSTYAKDTLNLARIKVRAIDLKTMPATGSLSNCEIRQLQAWIDANHPEN
jgi:hypothetical protein